MTENNTKPAVAKCKTALARQRRMLLILGIAVVVLAVALALVMYVTSRITFYDPVDNAKYQIVKVKKTDEEIAAERGDDEEKEVEKYKYVMKDENGEILSTTEEGNYITVAGTLVYVNASTGEYSTVAAVLSEDGDTVQFNSSSSSYDVLLYPLLQRANIAEITVHNENGEFTICKVITTENGEDTEEFVLEKRPDLLVSDTALFATLVYCTGNTRTMMRLDTAKVKLIGYAEYGLPDNTDDATRYFEIVSEQGTTHKVIIGNEVPSGDGYYVRYAGRDAVYVLYGLTATDYNGTFEDALFGKAEDFVTVPTASYNMASGNYFDVSDFVLSQRNEQGDMESVVAFSYSGSIDKRNNTFYSSVPYITNGGLAGYTINSYRVDDCLYQLYTWAPDRVASLGTVDTESDINKWLSDYGLSADSYAYRLEFIFNKTREYDKVNDNDTPKRADQEKHIILISERQEDGYYYVYNICYTWDKSKGEFATLEAGYNMIVAIDEEQMNFLNWGTKDWTSKELFSGHIAYMEELSVEVAPGDYAGVYEDGYKATFQLDNSETLKALSEAGSSSQISADNVVVRDLLHNNQVIDTTQFKRFYSFLLYTTYENYSSLDSDEQEAYKASGDDGAWLVIRVKYVLREWNEDTKYYDETGEVIERTYRFYYSLGDPTRQAYTTVNGEGEFYTLTTRVEDIIENIEKLYHPETPISIK